MPLYEYECQNERTRFEVIQKFSDPPVETCPACGGPVRRLLSSPAIQFKGSGWYVTDYARKGSTDSGKDSKPSSSSSTSDSSSSTDSKVSKPAPASSSSSSES